MNKYVFYEKNNKKKNSTNEFKIVIIVIIRNVRIFFLNFYVGPHFANPENGI